VPFHGFLNRGPHETTPCFVPVSGWVGLRFASVSPGANHPIEGYPRWVIGSMEEGHSGSFPMEGAPPV
jgi:hypothetical protein